ncbi:MAG: hypothetical protein ACOCRZ_06335 [Halothermotrichaceae bacterium]
MGSVYVHTCSNCGYTVETSGPWEFYRDSEGKRKLYGHPAPVSEEARERGIYGLSAKIYCPECDNVHDLIIVEYKKSTDNTLQVWLGECEPKNTEVPECPGCGNRKLVFVPDEDRKVKCPRCNEGVLEGRQEWIS